MTPNARHKDLVNFDRIVDAEFDNQVLLFDDYSVAALALLTAYEIEAGTGAPKEGCLGDTDATLTSSPSSMACL